MAFTYAACYYGNFNEPPDSGYRNVPPRMPQWIIVDKSLPRT